MPPRYRPLTALLNIIGSGKLALALVLLVILFSLAGAVLPQEGAMEAKDIALWQAGHPTASSVLQYIGLFHVFHSWPFLGTILLLAINTFTCTVLHFIDQGGVSCLKGPGAIARIGFFVLHLSLILLFAGGFWSAATRLTGYIVLTEGQSFREQHDSYLRLVEGPLRKENHEGFDVILRDVKIEYQGSRYPIDVSSYLEIVSDGNKVAEGVVKVNRPFTYKALAFTQDKTGYSPRVMVREKENGRVLLNSFVALQTFGREGAREYHDFLPLMFLEQKVFITLYPSFSMDNGKPKKTAEEVAEPVILIETEDEDGKKISLGHVGIGDTIEVQGYSLGFMDLRKWSAFKIVSDPGYPAVYVSLWLGLGALLLRYVPELLRWLGRGDE